MTDLPNRVSKKQLHLMAIIIFITLEKNSHLERLDCFLPKQPTVFFLRVSASLLVKRAESCSKYQNKQIRSICTGLY